jgi:hypothetical protein
MLMPENKKQKSIDSPITEITLRKYEKPSQGIGRRELVRRICLSLGLLQPGDSRDVIVDIFQVIIDAKHPLSSSEIMKQVSKHRKENSLPEYGVTYPNLCRQIRRLKQMMLVDSKADKYKLAENAKLKDIFNEKIIKFYIPSISDRINEYLNML